MAEETNPFKSIAASMEEINRQATSIQTKIRKDLVDSVKELSEETKSYEGTLKNSSKWWFDQSSLIDKFKDAQKASNDLAKRAVTMEKAQEDAYRKLIDAKRNGSAQQVVDAKKLYDQTTQQLNNLESSSQEAARMARGYKEAFKNSQKLNLSTSKLAGFLKDNFKTITDAVSFGAMVKFIGESDARTVELAKTLGVSREEAANVKLEFAKIALTTNQAAINVKSLEKGFASLAGTMGAVAGFTEEQLLTQTRLTKLVGLSDAQAASIQKNAMLSNQTAEESTKEILQQVKLLEAETGIRVDGRQVLKEVANINGQLSAQYQFNNQLLAQAVVKVKQFGLNLKEAEAIANNLLNFEQSIGAELSAELLTGKNLNLERARLLALQGDTAAAAEEVARQFGSAEEFTSMNVLQQRELAKAVGLTADQLADSIRQRDVLSQLGVTNIEQLKEEGRLNELLNVQGGEALYNQLQQQSVQEKFNDAVIKLQSSIASVAETLSPVFDLFHAIADSAAATGAILGVMAGVQLVKMFMGMMKLVKAMRTYAALSKAGAISQIFKQASIPFVGTAMALAGVGALLAALASARSGDDVISPGYGKRMIFAPEGAVALNDNDYIFAGTNPTGKGKGGGTTGGGMSRADMDYMAKIINDKKVTFDPYDSAGPQAMANSYERNNIGIFD